jgi:hypothetical protein
MTFYCEGFRIQDSGFRTPAIEPFVSAFICSLAGGEDFRFKISDFSRDGLGMLILAFHPFISSFILSPAGRFQILLPQW